MAAHPHIQIPESSQGEEGTLHDLPSHLGVLFFGSSSKGPLGVEIMDKEAETAHVD
jgi:hypothetical protein